MFAYQKNRLCDSARQLVCLSVRLSVSWIAQKVRSWFWQNSVEQIFFGDQRVLGILFCWEVGHEMTFHSVSQQIMDRSSGWRFENQSL